MAAAGVPTERVRLDVSIARGLDYYTGTVFETFLDALPGIGSVCSGGRYDNLAELFTSQELPGIGASLGLDRLLAAMEELGMIEKVSTPAPVFIPFFDKDRLHDYLRLAAALRAAGIGVEVFPDPKKLGQQLKYADRRGFRIALIAGGNEFQAGVCQVKDLQTGAKQDVPLGNDAASVIAAVRKISGRKRLAALFFWRVRSDERIAMTAHRMIYDRKHHAAARTSEYLFNQLIPYIGNKRKLLKLIHQAIQTHFPADRDVCRLLRRQRRRVAVGETAGLSRDRQRLGAVRPGDQPVLHRLQPAARFGGARRI